VHSRRLVGWALTTHLRTDLPLEALEMAVWVRNDRLDGLIHHSDAGSQYLAIRYADTLAGVGALPSVGSVGDSYDNALAESTIGQIKAELIHRRGPWRTVEQLEYALLEYLDWWNHRRLHGEIGMRTPPKPRPPTTLNPGYPPRRCSQRTEPLQNLGRFTPRCGCGIHSRCQPP
jgi:putative transposase